MKRILIVVATILTLAGGCGPNESKEARIRRLESEIKQVTSEIRDLETRVRSVESSISDGDTGLQSQGGNG